MVESIQLLIAGLYIAVTLFFYIIVFVFLVKISSKLQELLEASSSQRHDRYDRDKANRNRGRIDQSISKIDNRLRNAEKEQERARKHIRGSQPGSRPQHHTSGRRGLDQRSRPYHPASPKHAKPSPLPRRSSPQQENDAHRRQPRTNISPRQERQAAQSATIEVGSEASPNPRPQEIKHGRRMQIKRRTLGEKEAENEAPSTSTSHDVNNQVSAASGATIEAPPSQAQQGNTGQEQQSIELPTSLKR